MGNQQISWTTLARILKAFPLLARKSGASAKELADELGIHNPRDVDRTFLPALEKIGVVVEDMDSGKTGITHRYRLVNTAVHSVRVGIPQEPLPPLSAADPLTPQERLVLGWMLQGGGILEEASGTSDILDGLRNKISRATGEPSLAAPPSLNQNLTRGLDSMFTSLVRGGKDYSGENGRFIIPLAEAIQDRTICTITYQSPNTAAKTWDIWPLYLVENKGALYVLAMADKYRNRYIPLAVDRLQECTPTSRHFDYPSDFDPQSWLDSAFDIHFDEPRDYRIHFNAATAPYIRERRWATQQTLDEQPDGSLIVSMTTRGYPDILRWVLGYGHAARVLEPPELALDIAKEAHRILGTFQPGASGQDSPPGKE